MSKSEILAAIEELRTSISKLQTSFDSNLQTTNPSPPPPITPSQYPHLLHRTHSTSLLPIRRLSPSEIEEKNDRGLCYNCDQTWSDTHRCRSKYLILFGTDDEDDFGDPKSPDFMAEVEVTVKDISSLCASELPSPSPHPFTGLDPLSLLPPIVLQPPSPPPPPPTSPLPIPPPPTEPPPNVLPSPAKPPPPPITPSASPPPILGSRFWLLVGSKDEIVAVAFGSISAAIADVLTVGVVSSFYPSMVVFAGQEVQLCDEPPPDLLGIPSRFHTTPYQFLSFAWIFLCRFSAGTFVEHMVHDELVEAIKEDADEGRFQLKRARLIREADSVLKGLISSGDVKVEPLEPTEVEPEPLVDQTYSVGSKCRFRHTEGRWYNGLIVGLEGSESAKIYFLTPTTECMLMCKFFLQQRCRFGSNCRISHGIDVPVSSLKKYIPTIWEQSLVGSSIWALADSKADIWREAELESWDESLRTGEVIFRDEGSSEKLGTKAITSSEYAQRSDEEESDLCSAQSDSSDDEDDSPQGLGFLEGTTLQRGVQTDAAIFATWENHTGGIASKMMANRGYREGM